MDYKVSAAKLEELNEIIGQQGGPATSAVSDALAAGDVPKAIEANKLDGHAWKRAQMWHDAVKGVKPPVEPTPPGTKPGTEPKSLPPGTIVKVDDIYPDGVNHTIKGMLPGGIYCYKLLGDKPGHNVSYSRPDVWCNIAYGPEQGSKEVPGQPGMGTAILLAMEVPAGSWVTMWLNDDPAPEVDAIYSAAPVVK